MFVAGRVFLAYAGRGSLLVSKKYVAVVYAGLYWLVCDPRYFYNIIFMSYYLETNTVAPISQDSKACKTCGKVKPLTDFYIATKRYGSLRNDCILCRRTYNQAYYRRIHPVADTGVTKLCTHCKQVKPVSAFYPDKSRSDNIAIWCRSCHAEYKASRKDMPVKVITQTDKKTKLCSTCMTEKPASAFHRHSRSPDGLNYKCKMCRSEEHQRKHGAARATVYTPQRHESYYL